MSGVPGGARNNGGARRDGSGRTERTIWPGDAEFYAWGTGRRRCHAPLAGLSSPGPQEQPQSQLPPPLVSVPTQPGATGLPTISAHVEGISGQATSPFYVVQPGDTLWALANRFGTSVETLRTLNKLGDQFIKP